MCGVVTFEGYLPIKKSVIEISHEFKTLMTILSFFSIELHAFIICHGESEQKSAVCFIYTKKFVKICLEIKAFRSSKTIPKKC